MTDHSTQEEAYRQWKRDPHFDDSPLEHNLARAMDIVDPDGTLSDTDFIERMKPYTDKLDKIANGMDFRQEKKLLGDVVKGFGESIFYDWMLDSLYPDVADEIHLNAKKAISRSHKTLLPPPINKDDVQYELAMPFNYPIEGNGGSMAYEKEYLDPYVDKVLATSSKRLSTEPITEDVVRRWYKTDPDMIDVLNAYAAKKLSDMKRFKLLNPDVPAQFKPDPRPFPAYTFDTYDFLSDDEKKDVLDIARNDYIDDTGLHQQEANRLLYKASMQVLDKTIDILFTNPMIYVPAKLLLSFARKHEMYLDSNVSFWRKLYNVASDSGLIRMLTLDKLLPYIMGHIPGQVSEHLFRFYNYGKDKLNKLIDITGVTKLQQGLDWIEDKIIRKISPMQNIQQVVFDIDRLKRPHVVSKSNDEGYVLDYMDKLWDNHDQIDGDLSRLYVDQPHNLPGTLPLMSKNQLRVDVGKVPAAAKIMYHGLIKPVYDYIQSKINHESDTSVSDLMSKIQSAIDRRQRVDELMSKVHSAIDRKRKVDELVKRMRDIPVLLRPLND